MASDRISGDETQLPSAGLGSPTLGPVQMRRLIKAPGRWGREIWIAIAQLTVLAVLLAAASRWVSGDKNVESKPSGESQAKGLSMPRINPFGGKGAQEGDALEGGAFRTQQVVDRALDFSNDGDPARFDGSEASRQRERDARDPSVKDFKGNLKQFEVPIMSGANVQRAVERREGRYLVRELHFDASRGIGAVTRHYRKVFRNQGYRLQETELGGFDGGGREMVGTKGRERVVAKIRVDNTGRSVQVSIRQRVQP